MWTQASGKGGKRPAFDPSVVEKIYATELGGGKEVSPDRAMLLEFSGYLESYLWPNFDAATATKAHVMSIVLVRCCLGRCCVAASHTVVVPVAVPGRRA